MMQKTLSAELLRVAAREYLRLSDPNSKEAQYEAKGGSRQSGMCCKVENALNRAALCLVGDQGSRAEFEAANVESTIRQLTKRWPMYSGRVDYCIPAVIPDGKHWAGGFDCMFWSACEFRTERQRYHGMRGWLRRSLAGFLAGELLALANYLDEGGAVPAFIADYLDDEVES